MSEIQSYSTQRASLRIANRYLCSHLLKQEMGDVTNADDELIDSPQRRTCHQKMDAAEQRESERVCEEANTT